MKKHEGQDVRKLTVKDVRLFLTERLSYHWKKLAAERKLIMSSFSRVGLSLPIDGSKDHCIKIQSGEHIPFLPIDLQVERNKIKEKEICLFHNELNYPKVNLFTGTSKVRFISQEVQQARDRLYADPPASTIDEQAWERFEDWYYSIEEELLELEDAVLKCEDTFFRDEPSSNDPFSDEPCLDDLVADANELLESLFSVIEKTRLASSKVKWYDRFTLVAAILMFADPVPHGIEGFVKRFRYIMDRC